MPLSPHRTGRDSWRDVCGDVASGFVRGPIVGGLLLVGLVFLIPLLEADRDSVDFERDVACRAERHYVQSLLVASEPQSMWVLRHSRSAEKFDVKTGRQLDEVDVGAGYLAGMQLNREGSRAVFTDSDGQLKVARRDQNKWETFSVSPTRGDFTHHALCPVADLLLIATTESLELWTFEDSLSPLIILPASRHLAWSEWSPDGSYLLVAFGDGALELRHGKTLDIVRTTQMAASGDVRCTWSPGGQYMAAYNRIGLTVSAATVWSLDNTAPSLRHVSCPLGALVAALSPDGCWLAVADLSSRVWLINVDEPSNRLDLGELTISPCAMRFATDGSSLLIGSIDGALRCWSLADRQLAWTLSDPET